MVRFVKGDLSDASRTMPGVLLLARLVCSDPECGDLDEVTVTSMEELDAIACECGCTWELLKVSLDLGVALRR